MISGTNGFEIVQNNGGLTVETGHISLMYS